MHAMMAYCGGWRGKVKLHSLLILRLLIRFYNDPMWVVTTVSEKYYRCGELLELIGLYNTMLMIAPIVFLVCAVGKCD